MYQGDDDAMMSEILGGLPGVDPNDPRIRGKKEEGKGGKSPKK